jgi:hypothetical protein
MACLTPRLLRNDTAECDGRFENHRSSVQFRASAPLPESCEIDAGCACDCPPSDTKAANDQADS